MPNWIRKNFCNLCSKCNKEESGKEKISFKLVGFIILIFSIFFLIVGIWIIEIPKKEWEFLNIFKKNYWYLIVLVFVYLLFFLFDNYIYNKEYKKIIGFNAEQIKISIKLSEWLEKKIIKILLFIPWFSLYSLWISGNLVQILEDMNNINLITEIGLFLLFLFWIMMINSYVFSRLFYYKINEKLIEKLENKTK